jgi:hypothetical protein
MRGSWWPLPSHRPDGGRPLRLGASADPARRRLRWSPSNPSPASVAALVRSSCRGRRASSICPCRPPWSTAAIYHVGADVFINLCANVPPQWRDGSGCGSVHVGGRQVDDRHMDVWRITPSRCRHRPRCSWSSGRQATGRRRPSSRTTPGRDPPRSIRKQARQFSRR